MARNPMRRSKKREQTNLKGMSKRKTWQTRNARMTKNVHRSKRTQMRVEKNKMKMTERRRKNGKRPRPIDKKLSKNSGKTRKIRSERKNEKKGSSKKSKKKSSEKGSKISSINRK